ncbi:hypothetical protein BpHYR1_003976 [Brachionus plicatilis]|uniref:Uncharacterized protein n=1 Tax=Brachionus plicatilis TaxID=10195 RepID=A0A3M7RXG2_BRAPC|nr:hypothetical protein BpHYR1_003976 [Brachionus plicatilis]
MNILSNCEIRLQIKDKHHVDLVNKNCYSGDLKRGFDHILKKFLFLFAEPKSLNRGFAPDPFDFILNSHPSPLACSICEN